MPQMYEIVRLTQNSPALDSGFNFAQLEMSEFVLSFPSSHTNEHFRGGSCYTYPNSRVQCSKRQVDCMELWPLDDPGPWGIFLHPYPTASHCEKAKYLSEIEAASNWGVCIIYVDVSNDFYNTKDMFVEMGRLSMIRHSLLWRVGIFHGTEPLPQVSGGV